MKDLNAKEEDYLLESEREDKQIEALQRPPRCEICEDVDGERRNVDKEGGIMWACDDCWNDILEGGE